MLDIDIINDIPVISVFMTTYNHEPYIAQALDSILMQCFSKPYEICISDDCSTDKTCEIIKEYQKKHLNIRLNINHPNIGLSKNVYLVRKMCRGKYLINLSGDDYWIDPNKLQMQYDFLETHPNYLAVCTAIQVRADNETIPLAIEPESQFLGTDITLQDFLNGHNMTTHGIMFRNVYQDPQTEDLFSIMPKMSPYIDDITDELLLHLSGKVYTLPTQTMVYRVRRNIKTDHNFGSINKGMSFFQKHIDLMNNLSIQFPNLDFSIRYIEIISNGFLTALKSLQLTQFTEICRSIPNTYKKRHVIRKAFLQIPAKLIERMHNTW